MEASAATLYRIAFGHGLGDAVMLTSLLRQLRWHDPDCRIELAVSPYRAPLFRGLADEIIPVSHFYHEPPHSRRLTWPFCETSYSDSPSTNVEACLRSNFGLTPAPECWGYRVEVEPWQLELARDYFASLPRKHARACVLHYRGITGKPEKDIEDFQAAAIINELDARGFDCFIWDANDKSPLPDVGIGQRMEEAPPLFDSKPGDCGMLAALLAAADLVIGVDSGLLHLASAVGTRAVGLWVRHHPLHFFCPDATTTHLIPKCEWLDSHRWLVQGPIETGLAFFEAHYDWRTYRRLPHENSLPQTVAEVLEGIAPGGERRYLDDPEADYRLRSLIAKTGPWTRTGWGGVDRMTVDRNLGFDVVFRHLAGCDRPTILETGTTRAPGDFGGAGSATTLFGEFARSAGGIVHSVDLDPANVRFSRSWHYEYGDRVQIHEGDSVGWLNAFDGSADLVYLDSCDIEDAQHATHCLAEAQAAAPKVKQGGLIAIDDTPEIGGELYGKGELAAPWLESQGWRVVHRGYQRILRKPE